MNGNGIESEAEIAVDEVILACQAAAGRYRDTGAISENGRWTNWFEDAARRRDEAATRLQTALREQGGLPHGREQETETVRSVATHLRAAIAGDQQAKLFEVCHEAENAVAEAIATARGQSLPETISATLARLADDVRDTLVDMRTRNIG
jgi:hypothetical protein